MQMILRIAREVFGATLETAGFLAWFLYSACFIGVMVSLFYAWTH